MRHDRRHPNRRRPSSQPRDLEIDTMSLRLISDLPCEGVTNGRGAFFTDHNIHGGPAYLDRADRLEALLGEEN